ncbi:ATP-grasp domain-containing protein [Brevundimonas variabilis]|uniref:Carbamoylphosphate synthase large subunit n=1 Tax=Brevundimonas variabilis TaxID=74312 RepID=A0A7W9CFT0_9CAUL|nr:alpha-L-glutamate ligase [Brevundimonas variabilis]MBB5744810.1 carbamoylphosphate synthase large subunit [Brevundimonas variabilis]
MSDTLPDLAIVYEHPEWFEPLFAALERAGVSYVKVPLAGHGFDPAGSPAPATVVFSRVAMSSFLRDPEHPIFYAQSLFEHWVGQGTRVVNASALPIDTSKARQLSLIARLGLKGPATRVAHRQADLPAAAEGLRFPVLVKADIGGSGSGIVRYDTPEDLVTAAAERSAPAGVNGISLIQEYAPRVGGKITRVETLAGKVLYALDVESPGDTFDLCPADACMVRPGAAALTMTRVEPSAEIVDAVERIAAAGHLEIGSVEYLVDERDGSVLFYDINALSNFVARPMEVLGFEPHDALVDWLKGIVAEQKAARALGVKA